MIISTIVLGIGHIGIHLEHKKEALKEEEKEKSDETERTETERIDKNSKFFIRFFRWIGIGILLIPVAATIIVIGIRNVTFLAQASHAGKGVIEDTYEMIGGQKQYLLIRGNNIENPVIIYLHGGPSSPDAYVSYGFTDYLVDDYTVIAWDQRGCGRTYIRNQKQDPENLTASYEQALQDLDELVDYARTRFKKEKVIIMGWSYGTILGTEYVSNHPEKVSHYFGIGQFVNMEENEEIAYKEARERAIAAGDNYDTLQFQINVYTGNKNLRNMLALRNETAPYLRAKHEANLTSLAILSPYFGMHDFEWFFKQIGDQEAYLKLNKQLFDILSRDTREAGTEFEIPMYYVTGSDDFTCNDELVEEYSKEISAPEKTHLLIEGCGHSVHYDQPERFGEIVKMLLNREVPQISDNIEENTTEVNTTEVSDVEADDNSEKTEVSEAAETPSEAETRDNEASSEMKLFINDVEIPVIWEENVAVAELLEELQNGNLVISMSMYSDFEQVGPLGKNYTSNDSQITTENGDIVLYSGSNIVLFYGSNSWAYTRLGKMDLSEQEVTDLLANGDVTVTLSK